MQEFNFLNDYKRKWNPAIHKLKAKMMKFKLVTVEFERLFGLHTKYLLKKVVVFAAK
jgi:hypothetical protein